MNGHIIEFKDLAQRYINLKQLSDDLIKYANAIDSPRAKEAIQRYLDAPRIHQSYRDGNINLVRSLLNRKRVSRKILVGITSLTAIECGRIETLIPWFIEILSFKSVK